jgi:succinate dehydrogenase/fumarate reductase flavoprotein subunit
LRAAIAAAVSDPRLKIALVSKVVPMRSHTVAAEGGSAGAIREDDSLKSHFDDTVGGGDWLCDQDAVEFFLAGASAVAVGTALFIDPATPNRICDGLVQYMEKVKVERIDELVGTLEMPGDQPAKAPYP